MAFRLRIWNLLFFPEHVYLKKHYLLLAGTKSSSIRFPSATYVHLKNGRNGGNETSATSLPGSECEILYASLKIGLLHKIHPLPLHGNSSITTDHDSLLLNVPLS